MKLQFYKENYNNNIRYFIAIISKYKNQNILPIEFNIFSCNQLLDEVILECKSNKLMNKKNNYFINKKIDFLIKEDYLLNKYQINNLNHLKEKIYQKNSSLVYILCLEIKKQFHNRKYFNYLVDQLILFLKEDENDNSIYIKNIVDNIYMELLCKGYSIKKISEMIEKLFSKSEYDESSNLKFPNSSFPIEFIIGLKKPKEINDFINNLSIYERINYIKNYYTLRIKNYYLIVPISGITLTNKILNCNRDINLYNPEYIDPYSLQSENPDIREDKFRVDYKNCANARVKINALNSEAAYKSGIKKLDNYINILKLISPANNLDIISNDKILLDNKKRIAALHLSAYDNEYSKRKFERNICPINEDEIFGDTTIKKINNKITNLICSNEDKKNNTEIILLNSVKKYSEALDNTNEQEAILKYWASIESLFDKNLKIENINNKFELIKEIISTYMTYSLRYASLHELYHELEIATGLRHDNKNRKKYSMFNLPVKLLKKVNLYEVSNKSFSLYPLIKYNSEIKKYIDDYYYFQKVDYVDKYFNDIDFSKKEIKRIKNDYDTSIIIIYRLRNQIIHNALSNDITAEFYLPLLKKISNFFINEVLDEYLNNEDLTINEIILKIYTKSTLFIKNSENCTLKSLLF